MPLSNEQERARGTPDNRTVETSKAPDFDAQFREKFIQLIEWRRDVRRFRRDPVEPELIDGLLDLTQLAPSVGNSQPWRWVNVDSQVNRNRIRENFARCNAEAIASFEGEHAAIYAQLKLEGLHAAPVQFAVFCDRSTDQGKGLGRRTIPRMLEYSVATMLGTFCLAARAIGLGVGWVSILDPVQLANSLDISPDWIFVAYLCVGWPEEEHIDPELVRHSWQERTTAGRTVIYR